ncbi:hypothetical protein TNCT_423401, partial [Trichonephila clavata]
MVPMCLCNAFKFFVATCLVFMLSTWQWVILTLVIPPLLFESGSHGAGVPATETSIEGSAVDLSHSPSARQQHCLDAFPTEFHINALLSKKYAWDTFFRKSSAPLITQGGTPSHGPDPVSTIQDPLGDAAEKGLLTSSSQPLTCVSGEPATSPPVSCVQDQSDCETFPTGSSKTSGLSRSWCAPVQVYSDPVVHRKCSELSQSLPLNLISLHHNSPIWPPVSPVQCLEASALVAKTHTEAPGVCPNAGLPVVDGSPSVSPGQPVALPSVITICEIPPKKRSPPSPQSPNILDIVLAGDISLPDSPDVVSLKEAWPGELNGSPPHPAFPPPSYAAVTAKKQTPKRATLFFCVACDKKFYTQHGLHCHVCAGAKTL